MYLIVVKFQTKPDWTDRWGDLVGDFTTATRAEPGNLWCEWSRSVEDPAEFVLLEAFTDAAAEEHVASDHFRRTMAALGPALTEVPRVVARQVDGQGWDELGEVRVD